MPEIPRTPQVNTPMTPQERQMAARRAAQQAAEQAMQARRAEQMAQQAQAQAAAPKAAAPAAPATPATQQTTSFRAVRQPAQAAQPPVNATPKAAAPAAPATPATQQTTSFRAVRQPAQAAQPPVNTAPKAAAPVVPATPATQQTTSFRAVRQQAQAAQPPVNATPKAAAPAAPATPATQQTTSFRAVRQPAQAAQTPVNAAPKAAAPATPATPATQQTTSFRAVRQPAQAAQPSVNAAPKAAAPAVVDATKMDAAFAAAATMPARTEEKPASAAALDAVSKPEDVQHTATEPEKQPAKPKHHRKDKPRREEVLTPEEEAVVRRGSNRWYTLGMIVFAVIFLFSAGMLVSRLISDRKAESEFSDLASLIEVQPEGEADPTAPADNTAKFAALSAKNADFLGWISIQGTNLNFPVMYRPTGDQFYLRHNFSGDYSVYGVPYLEEKCTVNPMSNNMVIYGHNMKTGTIFGCLTEYKNASYYEEHPNIEFDTLYGDGNYEVWGAFAIDVATDTSFVYNTYLNMDEERFNEFVSQVKSRSDVDSGITPVYGDQLLTLSTCEYSSNNGRYVVCARKVDPAS